MASRLLPIETPEENQKDSDFIDNLLLKAKHYTINDDILFGCGEEFVIDGKVFKENIKAERFREFELYSLNYKMDDSADTSAVSMDEDTTLALYYQPVPHGIIINSNVYLTHQQWNTLYLASEDFRRCAVCEMFCDVTEHVTTTNHKNNMDRYKPLNKFDLSITRKIKTNYHCGVCNELFNESLKDEHFSSKPHEDKMLFAINKVSDIMYDFNMHDNNNLDDKKDTYHFDAAAINSIDDLSSDDEINEDDDYNYNDNWNQFNELKFNDDDNYEVPATNLAHSYASMARKPKTEDLPAVLEIDLGNKKVTVKFDSWNMVIRPKLNRFYCMACKKLDHVRRKAEHCRSEEHLARLDECVVVDQYEKYLVRQVNAKLYHCGHCNNLQLIHEMEDHIDSQHPNTGQTQLFESPSKKLIPHKTNTPVKSVNTQDVTFNKVNNDNKNEIVTNEHNNHARMDSPARINDNPARFNDNPARINDNPSRINDSPTRINDSPTRINDNPARMDQAGNNRNDNINIADNIYDNMRLANSNFDDITICAYGSEMRISKIAYNIVCQGEKDYYCGLCEVNIIKDHLKLHVNDLQHLVRLQRTPFIEAFNVHLFREIRDALHCALCNELIQIVPEYIIKHKFLEKHVVSLSRALGHIKNDKSATAEAKTAINENVNNNLVTDNKPKAVEVSKSTGTVKNVTTAYNVANNAMKETPAFGNKNVALSNIPAAKNVIVTKNIPNTASTVNNKNIQATVKNLLNVVAKETPKDIAKELEAEILAAQIEAKNEEFVVVKNGVKEEVAEADDLDESLVDDFDFEEYIYVKLGNNYIKITNTSYNTLVNVGDGSKYCFVCSSVVSVVKKHIESRAHMENIEKFKFVDKYNEDLLRQFYLMYHCSICNVVITRKHLNHHLSWPTHTLQTENTKISSKKRKNEIKMGTKQIAVATQKENIYLNEKETDIKIFLNISIVKDPVKVDKKNKIVIFNDNVLKVEFDCWHSLSETASGYRCKVCQCDFGDTEFGAHIGSDRHKGNLDRIEKQYSRALIRKINDTTLLNCIVCNTEVSNKKLIITEHIQGKKHLKHYETMLKNSSVANSYADCDEDVLML